MTLSHLNAQEIYPIHQRAKIYFKGENNLQKLIEMGVHSDHGIHKKGIFIISEFSTQELQKARQEGYDIEVIIPNLKDHFLAQNQNKQSQTSFNLTCDNAEETYPTPVNFNQGSMGGYLTYQETLDELEDMRSLFPNLISEAANISTFLTEGNPDNSVSPSIGGNGIKWIRISDNPDEDEDEPEVLYTSLHHAREPMSLMQNIYFMWYLLENYETDPEIQAIVDNTELYFVPVVNPDGYLFNEKTDPNGGGFWRKNRKGSGVDNNRNYDYHINGDSSNTTWSGPGSSSNPGSETYHGTAPFSEVENQAIKWLVEQHDFLIALNSHSFGEILFRPFAYSNVPTPDEALLGAIGSELTSRNRYSSIRDSPFSGDSDDFMYGTVGTHNTIFSFTPEIGTSFWPPTGDIDPLCKEMMYQNITAAQMVNNFGQLNASIPFFTEDNLEIEVPFSVKNIGSNSSGDFTVFIEAISDNINNTGKTLLFNELSTLETRTGIAIIEVDPAIISGESIIFDIVINNGLYNINHRFTTIFGAPILSFQNNGDSSVDNFEPNDWGTTSTTFQSPGLSITDSPNGNYSNNENTSIQISQNIDLTNAVAASISFYTRFDIEANFDYAQLEISTDNGANWEPQCTNLTSTGSSNQAEGEPLYSGELTTWTFEEINLNQYLGQSIIARFRLVTDTSFTFDGFYFDDLQINVLNPSNLSVDNNTFEKIFTLYPNPVKNTLSIQSLEDQYSFTIYTILGQEIIQQSNQTKNTNIDLSHLETGIYFITLYSPITTRSFKIIKK